MTICTVFNNFRPQASEQASKYNWNIIFVFSSKKKKKIVCAFECIQLILLPNFTNSSPICSFLTRLRRATSLDLLAIYIQKDGCLFSLVKSW